MSRKAIWTGRVLGALGMLTGVVVCFRYLVTTAPSDLFLGLGLGSILMIAAWIFLDWDLIAAVTGRRGTRRQAGSWLLVVLGIGIAVLVNFLSYRHHWERDITEGSIHSLSQETLDVLEGLDQEVHITGFYKQMDAAGEAFRTRELFLSLVERYEAHTDLMTSEVVDPDIEPALAIDRGVFQNGVVFVTCGDREERVMVPDENDLTNALVKVTRDGTKTVYFLAGHGEHDITSSDPLGYAEVKGKLEQTGFIVKEIELYRTGLIPADATVLIIAGPATAMLPSELPLIRDFVERRGGGLMVLLEPEVDSGLEPLLAGWGIEVGQDMVVDLEGQAMVGDHSTIFANLGYHEITAELAVPAILQQARTVGAVEGRMDVHELLMSGRSAWAESDLESLELDYDPDTDQPGPLALAAVVEVPRVPVDGGAADDDDSGKPRYAPAGALGEGDGAMGTAPVLVIGDSDLAANGMISLFGNADLVLNSLSYMAREEDLITIRARDEEDRPIHLMGWQRALIGVIAVPGMTMLVLLGGIIAWFTRLAR